MGDSDSQVTVAKAPFNDTASDLVLRTTDNVDFHVHSLILRLSSSHFPFLPDDAHESDSLAQAISSQKEPQLFPEQSTILDSMLRFCYPCADPTFSSLDEICEVIAAMAKHSFEDSTVMRSAAVMLLTPKFLNESPVRVFAIGCKYGWQDVVEAAARATGKQPMDKLISAPYPPEVDEIPSSKLLKLIQCRQKWEDAACKAAEGLLECVQFQGKKCSKHDGYFSRYTGGRIAFFSHQDFYVTEERNGGHQLENESMITSWLFDFVQEILALIKGGPMLDWDETTAFLLLKYSSIASKCKSCRADAPKIKGFCMCIQDAVEEVNVDMRF
jgi:hypothetical protein